MTAQMDYVAVVCKARSHPKKVARIATFHRNPTVEDPAWDTLPSPLVKVHVTTWLSQDKPVTDPVREIDTPMRSRVELRCPLCHLTAIDARGRLQQILSDAHREGHAEIALALLVAILC